VHFVGLYYSIILQCTVQKHKVSPASIRCCGSMVSFYAFFSVEEN